MPTTTTTLAIADFMSEGVVYGFIAVIMPDEDSALDEIVLAAAEGAYSATFVVRDEYYRKFRMLVIQLNEGWITTKDGYYNADPSSHTAFRQLLMDRLRAAIPGIELTDQVISWEG